MGQALWGIKSGDEAKPNWLTDDEKENTFASNSGWVLRHASGIEETLVAIADLKSRLGAASITEVKFGTGTYTAAGTKTVRVTFNEKVTVTGSPTLVVTGKGGVASVAVDVAGTGYTTAPTVAFSGGGGTGATATATVVAGEVTAITVTNAGTGYTSAPTVTLTGVGADATAIATINSAGAVTATYSSTTGQGNVAVFSFTVPVAGNVLTIGAQSISLAGGTIVETDVTPTVNAALAISASIATAAGTKTTV
jgi:hypothetical protein